MDIDIQGITLAALLTTAGSTAAAGLITGLVAVIRSIFPGIDGHEKQAAAVIALVLVLVCAVQAVITGTVTLDLTIVLAVVFAWYAVTRLAMSIYDDVARKPAGLRGGDTP